MYRLITAGTIEEKVYHRQIYKQFLTEKARSHVPLLAPCVAEPSSAAACTPRFELPSVAACVWLQGENPCCMHALFMRTPAAASLPKLTLTLALGFLHAVVTATQG